MCVYVVVLFVQRYVGVSPIAPVQKTIRGVSPPSPQSGTPTLTARYRYACARAGAVRQQQSAIKLTHLVVVVAVALLAAASGRAVVVIVGRSGRRFFEYQRAMAVGVAVGAAVLKIVRQQRVPAGITLVRLQQQGRVT